MGSFSDVWQMKLRRYQQQGLASLIQLWSLVKTRLQRLLVLETRHFHRERLLSFSYGVYRLVVLAASCLCGFFCFLWMNVVFGISTNLHVPWTLHAIWCQVYESRCYEAWILCQRVSLTIYPSIFFLQPTTGTCHLFHLGLDAVLGGAMTDCGNQIFKAKCPPNPLWRMPKVSLAGVSNPVRNVAYVTADPFFLSWRSFVSTVPLSRTLFCQRD